MSNLSVQEKVEGFYSRNKSYINAYRGFRTKYGTKKWPAKTPYEGKKYKFYFWTSLFHAVPVPCCFEIFMLNNFYRTFLCRIIGNFMSYGIVYDRRHSVLGRPRTVTIEEMIDNVERHFKENPNHSVRKAAQAFGINKELLRLILKYFLRLHPYKITTHQLLTEAAMTKRV